MGALCVFELFLDYLQYLLGYLYINNLRKRAEANGRSELEYDYKSVAWRLRTDLFYLKQLAFTGAVVFFLVVFVKYIFSLS